MLPNTTSITQGKGKKKQKKKPHLYLQPRLDK